MAFLIERQFKQLLVMLGFAQPCKKLTASTANTRWQFSPSPEEKEIFLSQYKENEPPEHILARLPLLKQ
jgi:hypothetical protein